MHEGKPWTGPDQFEDSTGKLMMLPTDMMLIAEPAFKKFVAIYAKDEDKFFTVSFCSDCFRFRFIKYCIFLMNIWAILSCTNAICRLQQLYFTGLCLCFCQAFGIRGTCRCCSYWQAMVSNLVKYQSTNQSSSTLQ